MARIACFVVFMLFLSGVAFCDDESLIAQLEKRILAGDFIEAIIIDAKLNDVAMKEG